MTISSQLLSPRLLISCWSLLFLHLLFCTVLLPFGVNQAIGKKQVLWEGRGKWAPAHRWYSSDHLELHHLHNVSQYLWGFAGSSASQNSNLNTGIMEIHQNHRNTSFTCFSPLGLCSIFFFFHKSNVVQLSLILCVHFFLLSEFYWKLKPLIVELFRVISLVKMQIPILQLTEFSVLISRDRNRLWRKSGVPNTLT